MSNEIKVGDKVTQPGDGSLWTVEHVRGEWAWCFGPNSHSGDLLFLETLTKYEEPKVWVKDRKYRNRSYGNEVYAAHVFEDGSALLVYTKNDWKDLPYPEVHWLYDTYGQGQVKWWDDITDETTGIEGTN